MVALLLLLLMGTARDTQDRSNPIFAAIVQAAQKVQMVQSAQTLKAT
jgi:hypothetical protein